MRHEWNVNSCARCGITRGRVGRYYANNGDVLECGQYPGFPIGEGGCGHPLAARRIHHGIVDCWACAQIRGEAPASALEPAPSRPEPIRVAKPAVQRPVRQGSTRLVPGYVRRTRRQGDRCVVFDVPIRES